MTESIKDLRILAAGLRFPEGPVAMPDGSVCLAEIESGHIVRVDPDGKVEVLADCGNGVNGLALGPDGMLYACNNGGLIWVRTNEGMRGTNGVPPDYRGGCIQKVNPRTGEISTLYERCADDILRGPNDLVFDTHGGFYFTDYGKTRQRDRDIGSVYYAAADGSCIREVIHPIANPNGIALSPDQKTLYVDETDTSRLWAYPVLSPGVLELAPFPSPNGGRLVHGLGGYQRMDGMAVQANGDICVATLIRSQITVVTPAGEIVREVKVPDLYPTNICFGGPDLKTAYITLSFSGRLMAMPWPEPGLGLNF